VLPGRRLQRLLLLLRLLPVVTTSSPRIRAGRPRSRRPRRGRRRSRYARPRDTSARARRATASEAASQRALPEAHHDAVELLREPRYLALRQLLDPERLDEVLDLPRRRAERLRLGDYRGEGLLGSAPRLEQPAGELRALAQLFETAGSSPRPGISAPPGSDD
jgi:hypothetical protein